MKIDDKSLATRLLERKNKDSSIAQMILRNYRRYIIYALAVFFSFYLASEVSYENNPDLYIFFITVAGIFIGIICRDIEWFRTITKVWPFNQKIIDWEKVEELAKEN